MVLNTAVFRLIRLPNLFIVGLVQVLVYAEILLPAFRRFNISPLLDPLRFAMLTGVTLCIAAGGYIINDIHDETIDRINRPQKVVVGRHISASTAHWLYFVFNMTGFTASLYLAFYVRQIALAGLFPIAGLGLFLYALRLKSAPLVGNLLVAAYCAGVAGVVWFAEREGFYLLGAADAALQKALSNFLAVYLALAFCATLFRELVKDLQDQAGDASSGARTLPLSAGVRTAKLIAWASAAAAGGILIYVSILLRDLFYAWSVPVFLCAVLIPLAWVSAGLARAQAPQEYRRLSLLAKWVIAAGLLLPAFIHL